MKYYLLNNINKTFIKYAMNTSWLLAEKLFRIVVSLFIGVWVANHLGSENFGILNFCLSIVGLTACFSNLGLDNIVIRELVNKPKEANKIISTALTLRILGSLSSTVTLIFFLQLIGQDPEFILFLFIVSLGMLFNAFNMIDMFFTSRVQGKISSLAKISALSISALFRVILIMNNATLVWFAAATAVDGLLLAISFCIAYHVTYKNPILNLAYFDLAEAKRLLKNSWPLIISGFVVSLYMKIDQVMIKFILGEESVGVYAVAVRLSEAFNFIPIIISASLFPAIIQSKHLDLSVYHTRLKRFYSLIVWTGITFAVVISASSKLIVDILYRKEFYQAADVLAIHVWSGVFVFIGVAGNKCLINENLQKFITLNTAAGALINIALNYYLLPRYGIIGASWATLISYALAAYLLQAIWPKTRTNFLLITNSLIPKR